MSNPITYVSIPISTMQSDQWKELAASTRCVYAAMLARYKRDDNEGGNQIKWADAELVTESGFSLKTVNSCTKELRSKEWIRVVERGGRWTDGTTYEVNRFYADGVVTEKPIEVFNLPPGEGCIYFIGNTDEGFVKIGYSLNDTEGRLNALQSANPHELSVLAIIDKSSHQGESMLHKRFAQYRIRGEWFRLSGELEMFIRHNQWGLVLRV